MAITLTGTPIKAREGVDIQTFTASNPLIFQLTAGAGETSVQAQVQNQAGTTTYGTLPTLPFTSAGTLDFDIAFILRNYLANDDNVDNARTWSAIAKGESIDFKLLYRVGGTGSYTILAGSNYVASNSARQLGSTFGATLAEYLPLMTGTTVDFTGKFLTLFENPVLFWYSSLADVNALGVSTNDISIFQPQVGFVTSESNNADITAIRGGGNAVAVDTFDLTTLEAGVFVTNLIFGLQAYLSDEIYIDIGTDDGLGGFQDAAYDRLTFTTRRVCQNPTAVRWLNSLGIWETWVFEGNSPYEVETSNGNEYGIYNPDISIATESSRILSKRVAKTVSLSTDNLLLDQVRAISEILYSPNVLIYTGEYADGIAFDTWEGAIIETGSFAVEDTNNKRHKISFDLRLKDIQTISN